MDAADSRVRFRDPDDIDLHRRRRLGRDRDRDEDRRVENVQDIANQIAPAVFADAQDLRALVRDRALEASRRREGITQNQWQYVISVEDPKVYFKINGIFDMAMDDLISDLRDWGLSLYNGTKTVTSYIPTEPASTLGSWLYSGLDTIGVIDQLRNLGVIGRVGGWTRSISNFFDHQLLAEAHLSRGKEIYGQSVKKYNDYLSRRHHQDVQQQWLSTVLSLRTDDAGKRDLQNLEKALEYLPEGTPLAAMRRLEAHFIFAQANLLRHLVRGEFNQMVRIANGPQVQHYDGVRLRHIGPREAKIFLCEEIQRMHAAATHSEKGRKAMEEIILSKQPLLLRIVEGRQEVFLVQKEMLPSLRDIKEALSSLSVVEGDIRLERLVSKVPETFETVAELKEGIAAAEELLLQVTAVDDGSYASATVISKNHHAVEEIKKQLKGLEKIEKEVVALTALQKAMEEFTETEDMKQRISLLVGEISTQMKVLENLKCLPKELKEVTIALLAFTDLSLMRAMAQEQIGRILFQVFHNPEDQQLKDVELPFNQSEEWLIEAYFDYDRAEQLQRPFLELAKRRLKRAQKQQNTGKEEWYQCSVEKWQSRCDLCTTSKKRCYDDVQGGYQISKKGYDFLIAHGNPNDPDNRNALANYTYGSAPFPEDPVDKYRQAQSLYTEAIDFDKESTPEGVERSVRRRKFRVNLKKATLMKEAAKEVVKAINYVKNPATISRSYSGSSPYNKIIGPLLQAIRKEQEVLRISLEEQHLDCPTNLCKLFEFLGILYSKAGDERRADQAYENAEYIKEHGKSKGDYDAIWPFKKKTATETE